MAISYILNGQAAVKDVNKISKATKMFSLLQAKTFAA